VVQGWQILVWALALMVATGCAEQAEKREFLGPPAPNAPPTTTISRLVVSPSIGTVQQGEPIGFAAFGRGSNGDSLGVSVMWTASGGSVDGSGVFSAPTPGTYWVVARSVQQADRADSAAVYVVGPDNPVTSVRMNPKHVNLQLGDVQQFTASAKLQSGADATVPIYWTASGGTIDATGRYSATDEGSFIVVAIAASGLSDTSAVLVQQRRVIQSVRIEPAEVEVVAGGNERFDVTAKWSDGSTSTPTAIDYSTDGGTIDANGNFTALTSTGEFVVIASARGTTTTATATVRVKPASVTGVSILPGSVQLSRGGWSLFLAAARYSDGATRLVSPNWKATGGTIDRFGVFRAGQTDGHYIVVASVGSIADTALVVIGQPAATLTSLILNPGTATVAAGSSQTFSVAGSWSDGSSTVPPVTYSATGGTISEAGVYQAGSVAGTYRVIATHAASSRADTSEVRVVAPSVTKVEINPERVTVETAGSAQFAASATLSDGRSSTTEPVTWSATGGTITSGGRYTAGTGTGTFRVIARSSSGAADTSLVTVAAPAPVLQAIAIAPKPATVQIGRTQTFVANGVWTNGGSGAPQVTWSATGGSITAAGVYTAGSTAGNFRVVARHQTGIADTSVVTIPQPAPVLTGIVLTPASATVQAGGTQSFAVDGVWTNGGSGAPAVTYSATGGSISSSGTYVAGPTAGTYRVIAVQQGGQLADTSVVTVTAAPPQLTGVRVTPTGVSVAAGGTVQYAADGIWTNGGTGAPAVVWSATGGTISSGGLYTAGSTAGTYRIIARQASGTLADTTNVTVTVTAPTLTGLTVQPKTVTVQTGLTHQFSASATWSNGSTTLPSIRWSATGGSITSSGGRFTAPSTPGTYRVIVRDANSTVADTATVNVTAPVVTAVALTPGNVTLQTGNTQQYQASATWSDGVSRPAAVSYTATGGSITTAGVYTAPQSAGSYRVDASASGVSASPSTVTVESASAPPPPPPSGGGQYPNRPANYTRVLSDYGFGDVVPNGREVAVGGGWGSSWNDAGLMRRGTATDAPVSASHVLEWAFTRTGTQSGGGVGNMGRGLPTVNQIYVSFWMKHDSQFEFHPISNKLLYLEPGNLILQTRMWDSNWFTINNGGGGGEFRATGYTLPLGQWVQVEYLVDAVNNRIRLWADGRLVVDVAANLAGGYRELKLDSTWGGSGGTKTRDSFRWIDHILVATP